MQSKARLRRRKTLAFCSLLLAVAAVAWFASARAPENEVISGNYTPVGNSYARFSSENVEVVTREGEVLYSAGFDHPRRALTASGEGAAAWSEGGEILLLGEGGYKRVLIDGAVCGVFGSDRGALAVVSEKRGEVRVSVCTALGEVLSISPDAWPVAAGIDAAGRTLALLTAGAGGFAVSAYSLPGAAESWTVALDSPRYDLEWTDAGTLRVFGGGEELYIDAVTGAVE